MPLSPGTRLGVYEITELIGAGGMGEVYRARDTALNRDVALKALPDAFASDPERLARFTREAQTLAALNHPNIAHIHGFEGSGAVRALVMELVQGEDLAQQLARGRIAPESVLPIATQIAEALEAAHEQGIVHRDLKPANIKLRDDGTLKVLDFGLAKAMDPAAGSGVARLANSPTITSPEMTTRGTILGTAAYMSPEQAKGLPVDHRSDVFSFGSVLYELLAARPAFSGDTAHDILASVIAREPDWAALPPSLDPRLASLLRRCLAKSRRQRWQAIGDVRAELELIAASAAPAAAHPLSAATPRPAWVRRVAVGAAVLATAALGGWVAWTSRTAPAAPLVVRFQVPATAAAALQINFNRQVLAVSPDGTRIVFGGDRPYVRSVSEAAAQPLAGTEGVVSVTHPAFSPDGRSFVFWAASDRTLKRVTVGSTILTTLCPVSEGGLGLTWAGDHIYFGDAGEGIKRVSANGGQPEIVVPVTGREEAYGPQLLPDGDTLMFTLGTRGMTSWDDATVVLQSLRTKERKTLVARATDARYLPTGHVIFGRGGLLFAAPLDLRQSAIVGEPIAVVEGVRRAAPGTTGATHVAVSAAGTLAYFPGPVSSSGAALQLAMFDRTGAAEPLNVPLGAYSHPRVSPDGSRVAVGVDDGREMQVWVHGLSKSSAARRLSFGGQNQFAEWAPDSQRVAFQSTREGDSAIWWQRADGTDTPSRLTRPATGAAHVPQSFSRDGRHLLFDEIANGRVLLKDLSIADGKVTALGSPDSVAPSDATVSPDGRWVAYTARRENPATAMVYVEPYPPTGARYQISKQTEDGHHPAWSRDGRELFYTPGPGNRFLAVPITVTPAFAFGDPAQIPRPFINAPPSAERTYDVSGDRRILGLRADVGPDGQPIAPQIQVVLNWFEELKQRVPIK